LHFLPQTMQFLRSSTLSALSSPGVAIAGAVLGRALYNGAIVPSEVLAAAQKRRAA
jgi:phosphoribosylformimino-5-aminoimidazole carboxamide ribonucleotide (ProFAR) isomerase